MSLFALSLILFSACIHVVQHIAIKRARDRTAFVWWAWFWGCALFSPAPFFLWQPIPARAWVILLISAIFELLYYLAITRAYQTGDLSVVYPLARGTAPVFILLWSMLFLGEFPSAGGAGGVGLIMTGLCVINLPRTITWAAFRQQLWRQGSRFAVLAGFCISCYTTIDKAGVRLVTPLLFTWLVMSITLLLLTMWVMVSMGWRGLGDEWRNSGASTILAGATAMAAFAIILYVMQTGVRASYVGATREISVVFGAVVGTVFLKEQGTRLRIAGAALIAAGVAAIAALG
ncbi:MAG: EamA family transporter [Blastocatellia bacterium]